MVAKCIWEIISIILKTEEAAAIKAHETITQNNFENKEINQDANTSTYISQKQQKTTT